MSLRKLAALSNIILGTEALTKATPQTTPSKKKGF